MSRVRSSLVGCVAACALLLSVGGGAARADDPPDLSYSSLACVPLAGTTRAGDLVLCTLNARVIGANALAVTADISIPDSTVYAPDAFAQGTPNDPLHPTSVHFGSVVLGLMNPGFPKPAPIRLRVADDADAGDPIVPVARLRDGATPDTTITAPDLRVQPMPADLSPSTVGCVDLTGSPPRPGDTLECTIQLTGLTHRENATGVRVTTALPHGTTWAAGGNETSHSAGEVVWESSTMPDGVVAGGSAPPLRFRVVVDPGLLGGTAVFVNAYATWTNALSGQPGSRNLAATALYLAPGPAVLTPSTLVCNDEDGPPLLAQDLIGCTVNVRPAAGHEDLADASASAPVPALTGAVSATDGGGRIPLPDIFGTIPAGAARAGSYRLRVAADAVAGNVIVPTALVTGRSTPSGVAVSQPLLGNALVVGERPAAVPVKVAQPAVVAAASTPTAARTPVICGSRRVVTVNVRPPKGKHWKAVTFAFSTKSVKGKKATGSLGKKGYFRARLVFQGLPKGPLKVAIKGVTKQGKTVKRSRTYNLCTPKRK
jgi:hypothetical protein